jgi:hypothetical protein
MVMQAYGCAALARGIAAMVRFVSVSSTSPSPLRFRAALVALWKPTWPLVLLFIADTRC